MTLKNVETCCLHTINDVFDVYCFYLLTFIVVFVVVVILLLLLLSLRLTIA